MNQLLSGKEYMKSYIEIFHKKYDGYEDDLEKIKKVIKIICKDYEKDKEILGIFEIRGALGETFYMLRILDCDNNPISSFYHNEWETNYVPTKEEAKYLTEKHWCIVA